MRHCIRIPRLFLPKEEALSNWLDAPLPGAPSARSLLPPEGAFDEELLKKTADAGYRFLEDGVLDRLPRGAMLVVRRTPRGDRTGFLACVDLEAVGFSGKEGEARTLEELGNPDLSASVALRERAVLEADAAVLCFRDKKDKILRALARDEIEPLYGIDLPVGRVEGYFVPAFLAEEYADAISGKADPCFGVLDGAPVLAAAKLRWDALKPRLSEREARTHPARYALAEFVNLCGEGLWFEGERAPEPDEIPALLKSGKRLPAGSFSLACPRLPCECREITYD